MNGDWVIHNVYTYINSHTYSAYTTIRILITKPIGFKSLNPQIPITNLLYIIYTNIIGPGLGIYVIRI